MHGLRRTVGRYEVLREIGRGGMSTVYLARQIDLDRSVALKELGAFRNADPSFAQRFLREARLAGSLSHPNVVTVHDYFESEGAPFIAMEYLERGSLRPYIGTLSLAQIGGVLEALLAGLAHAEAHGIVHRDLKPENLLVTGDGLVKIADFGIAKATNALQTNAFLTQTGVAVGTPNYISPEQAMAQEIGPWTDLYSAGVVAFELLVGRAPFADTPEPMGILLRQINETIPPVTELAPHVEPLISDWIEWLVSKEPSERPQTAGEAWEDLEERVIALLGPRWRRQARLPDHGSRFVAVPGPATPPPANAPPGPLTEADIAAFSERISPPEQPPPASYDAAAGTVMPAPHSWQGQAADQPPPPPPLKRRRTRWWLGAAVLIVTVPLAVTWAAAVVRGSSPAATTGATVTAPSPANANSGGDSTPGAAGGSQTAAGAGGGQSAAGAKGGQSAAGVAQRAIAADRSASPNGSSAAAPEGQSDTQPAAPAPGVSLAGRAATLRSLARQYENSALRVAALAGSSPTPNQASLLAALRRTAQAYRSAASAATANDATAYAAALAAAVEGRKAVEAAIARMTGESPARAGQPGEQSAPESGQAQNGSQSGSSPPASPCSGDSQSDDASDDSCEP